MSAPNSPSPARQESAKKKKLSQAELKGLPEEAALKPTMPNAHVLNVAAFERLQREHEEEERQRREAQRLRRRAEKAAAAAGGASRTGSPKRKADGSTLRSPSPLKGGEQSTLPAIASRSVTPAPPPPPGMATTMADVSSIAQPTPARAPRSPSPNASGEARPVSPVRKRDFTTLMTILAPREEFQSRVRQLCRLDHMEIAWLLDLHGTPPPYYPPSPLLTIDGLSDDYFLKQAAGLGPTQTLLNSPRSVLACLRAGIGPMEVQRRPPEHFQSEANGQPVPAEVALRRYDFFEGQRRTKLAILQKEYAAIREHADLPELLNFFGQYDARSPATADAVPLSLDGGPPNIGQRVEDTAARWVELRRAKMAKMLAASTNRVELAVRQRRELEARLAEQQEERRQFEQHLQEQKRLRQREAQEREVRVKERRLEAQRELQRREQAWLQEVQQRSQRLLGKDERRAQQLAEQQERRRQQYEAQQTKHAERLRVTRSKLEEIQTERRQRMEEKEEVARRKREELERQKAAEREAARHRLAEFEAHVAEIRQQAVQRALESKTVAETKQAKADQRLAEFTRQKEEQRSQQHEADQQRAQKRQQVSQAVREEEERRREQRLQRQRAAEEQLEAQGEQRRRQRELEQEEQRFLQLSKLDNVERQRRMRMFEQLRTLDGIQRKADRILRNEALKAELVRQARAEQEELRVNRERTLRELSSTGSTLPLRSASV